MTLKSFGAFLAIKITLTIISTSWPFCKKSKKRLVALYFTFQALHKHLKEEGYAYLGLPYWNWVKNMTIPTIFDGLIVLGLPNMVDRMIDIKRGNNKRLPIKVCG